MRKNHSSPRPLSASLSRFSSSAAVCAALVMACASTAGATTYYWDANGLPADNDIATGTGLGGAGIWNVPTSATPNAFWFDPLVPANNIVWPNTTSNTDLAVFMGTAGTVSLGAPVLVNALQFDSTGFLINNGGNAANTLTLSGSSPLVAVSNSAHTATISALVAGTQGLTKMGAGTLVLGGGASDTLANTFTGALVVEGGTLRLDKAAGTLATASTSFQVNSGTVFMGSGTNLLASNLLPANTDLTISGGAFNFHAGTGISAASQTLRSLTISGGTLGTTTGTFTDAASLNTINITNSFNISGGTPTINSGTTITAGNFTISGGTLTIGGNTALKKTTLAPSSVNLNGGTIQMNFGTATGAQRGEFVLSSDVLVGGAAATTFTRGGTGTATSEPAIVLNDPARIFNVADATGSTASDLTVNVRLDNGGLVKTGAGTMTLNGTGSQFTGDVLVQQGTLAFVGSGNADQTALGTGPKTITLTNNATLALVGSTDADPNVGGGKGFVIGTGGGTIDVTSGRTFFLNDGVANGSVQNQLQGSGTLTKSGLGVLNVGRDFSSTFTGDVNVNLGRLDLTVSNAVGNAGKITVDGTAGASRLNLTSGTAFALTNDVVLQNGGVFSTQSGNHNLANNKTFTIGAGTPRIRVDDGSSATTTATNRTFVTNGAVNGSGTVEVSGPSGTTRGVLAISNTQGNFSGTIIIDKNVSVENYPRFDGTVATNTGKTIGTGTIKFASVAGGSGSTTDGQLDLRDNGTASNQVLNYGNNVDMTATGGTISVGVAIAGTGSNTGNRFVLGSLGLGAGNTITVNTTNSYSLEFAGATTLGGDATFAGTSDLTLGGGITGGANLVKNGAGRLTIGAPTGTTYTGSTAVNGGAVVFNSASAIGGTGANVTVANGGTVAAGFAANQSFLQRIAPSSNTMVIALAADSANNLDLAGFTGARLGAVGNATYTGTLTPAGTATANYLLGGGGGTLAFANANALTGSRGLDINTNGSAAGTISLPAANNFSGAISVGGGMTLRAGSNASLGSGTAITLDNGTLQFANGGNFTGFGTRTITVAAGGATLDTDGNDFTLTNALIGGTAGGLTKAGAGTLTLTQNSVYTGATIIRGGTLAISAADQLGTGSSTTQLQLLNGSSLQVTAPLTIVSGRGISLGTGGGIFDVTGSNTFTVSSTIIGSGAFTKNGTGTMTITADPNNTGGFTINGGVLEFNNASGTTDGHIVVNSGGTLRNSTAALGDSYNVTVNSGGIWDVRTSDQISRLMGDGLVTRAATGSATVTVNSSTSTTFAGVIENGLGTVAFTKAGANTVTLTGANTYSGATQINQGTLSVEGATAALGNTTITVGDNNGGDEVLTLGQIGDVWTTVGGLNRIGDTGGITLNGRVRAIYSGPAAGSSGFTETMGALTTSNGANVFTVTPGIGAEVQLNASSLTRSNSGTLLIRGDNLGGTGLGSTRIVPTTASLTGGGGAAGSTTISILPWAVGDTSSTGAGTSFVTVGANGVRLLTNSEYASTIAGITANRNVSVAGGETVSGNVSINALRITGGTTMIGAGAAVTVGSGAVLFTGDGEIAGAGALNFGTSEGIVQVSQNDLSATIKIGTSILGGNGVTVGTQGFDASGNYLPSTVVLGGANKFAGNLTVNQGVLRLENSQAINQMNPNPLLLRPGATLQIGGNNVTLRNIQGAGGGIALQNASENNATFTALNSADTTFSGPITDGVGGGALSLVKRGANSLTLNSGVSNFSGSTTIERGALILSGSGDLTSAGTDGTDSILISGGGTLRLDNATNNTDRLRNSAAITMSAGTFDFTHGGSSGTNYAETTGALKLDGGFNTVNVRQAASGNTSVLTLASLSRTAGSQAQINFGSNVTTALGVDGRSRLVLTEVPALNDGLIGGWAFINGTDFATYNTAGTISVATAATTTDAETAWDTTKNIKLTATPGTLALTANRVVNSLNLASGYSLDLGGKSLNIDTGGFIHQTTVTTDTVSNGSLTPGSEAGADLVLRTSGTGTLTVSATVTDNAAGAVGLIKTGGGKLVLSGANTYTGPTAVGGTLSIANDSALGVAPAAASPSHLKLNDSAVLEVTSSMALNANRGIQLNGAGATIAVTTGNTLTYNGSITSTAQTDFTITGLANIGSAAQPASLNIGGSANFNGTQNVVLGGASNAVGSTLNLGTITSGTSNYNGTLAYGVAGGSLSVGLKTPGVADLNIAYRTIDPTSTSSVPVVASMDLRGSENFTAALANLRVGVATNGGSATVKGDLFLPTNSTISAGTGIVISDSSAVGLGGAQSSIVFGSGSSVVTTSSVIVGGRKGTGLLSLAAGGTLNLGGFGSGQADLLVAYNNQDNTGVTTTGTADFSAGTLLADLDEIVVGFKNGAGGSTGGATGTLTLGASANSVVANQIRLGDYSGGSSGTAAGTLNIGGGNLTVNTDVTLGLYTGAGTTGGAAGTLNITGGSVTVGGSITTSNSARATATLNLDGGTLDMTAGSINVDSFTAQRGTLKNVSQVFSGDGVTAAPITKTGAGILAIEGQNTYTGDTMVNSGSVLVNGSIAGSVAVASSATLGGIGSIGGNVTVAGGGSLGSVSAALGTLDVAGSLTLADNSSVSLQLNGLAPGDGAGLYGQINTAGSATLGENVTLSLSLGFAPNVASDTFYFILNRGAGSSGTFANLAEGAKIDLGNGFIGTITYQANWTGDVATSAFTGGNDIAIAVPEPGTALTLMSGLGALLGLGRFRRRRS